MLEKKTKNAQRFEEIGIQICHMVDVGGPLG